jgi:prepilin-type N-terminal cleavage/methylation domain-containing protein
MRQAFTLIEIIVVLGVVAILLALSSINLLTGQRKVAKIGVIEQLVADIKSQQLKAMTGQDSGSSFGVHLNENNYILFTGSTFSATDSSNFVVNLDNKIILNTTFPNSNILFTPVSGEITGYVIGSDSFSVIDSTDNTSRQLHVNRYGVVDVQN